ncbi:MAG: superoxide dismutase [Patescibacteria group bacterium]|nr:superoxide dismutase [Patescibacteria group bacterium]
MFTLRTLPYDLEALEPHMSAQTLEFHYGKHHRAYVDNLNKLIEGTGMAEMSLEEIIKLSAKQEDKKAIFNNAAQVYNHNIFWDCLRPTNTKMEVPSSLMTLIERDFGSLENMLSEFKSAALTQFGSGWAWLVKEGDKLKIMKTANADTAFLYGVTPILALDVWEHSYYLDYQNRRADFISAIFDNLLNWDFAAKNAGL